MYLISHGGELVNCASCFKSLAFDSMNRIGLLMYWRKIDLLDADNNFILHCNSVTRFWDFCQLTLLLFDVEMISPACTIFIIFHPILKLWKIISLLFFKIYLLQIR